MKGNTGKNFSEGWVEFLDKKVAKKVALHFLISLTPLEKQFTIIGKTVPVQDMACHLCDHSFPLIDTRSQQCLPFYLSSD